MNQRRHLSLVAAAATLMAAAPIKVLFNDWSWLVDSIFVVAIVCAVGIGSRAMRLPVWAQPVVGLVAVMLVVTLVSVRDVAIAGLIPGPAAWHKIGDLLTAAGNDIRTLGIPVDSDPGLLMLTTAGIGIVAVFVDFLAVSLHRPAAAGLPLLAVYAVPVAIDTKSIYFAEYAIGAAGYLWLLVTDNVDRVRVFGRRFTGEGKGVDMWEPSPLAAVGRRIAVGCVALAILVPLVVPGFNTTLVGVLGTVGGSGDGTGNCPRCAPSGSVNLLATLAGKLNENDTITLAHVTTSDATPEYLRFAVATQLTKNGFLTVAPVGQPLSRGTPNSYIPNIPSTHQSATVTVASLNLNYLPIYALPTNGTLQGIGDDWRFDQDSDEIFSTQAHTTQGMSYSFEYDKPTYTPELLRTALPLKPSDPLQRSMTAVPENVKQVEDIVKDPSMQANDEYDRVLNLYKYFSTSNGFFYSTSTKPGTTGTDIGNFLTQKTGFCVQYAAALAWVVRAAGFPARVALGFNLGTKDNTGVWSLTNKALHAWTEVYFDGFGWVPFDATPSAGGTSYTAWAPNPNAAIAPGGNGSTGPDENITPGSSAHPNPGLTERGTPGGGIGPQGGSSVPWWTYVVILALLAIAASPFAARARLRRLRTSAGSFPAGQVDDTDIGVLADDGKIITAQRRRVHAVWDEFVDTLVDFGIGIDPTETPRAAAERVAGTPYLSDDVVRDVQQLGQAEERARYAARPGMTPSFAAALRRIRRAFADRAPWRTRLRALLLPPSVTSRWRGAVVGAAAQASAWMQGVRDAVVRTVNVRARLASSRR
ncbi:MAG TPA: DUF3488 and transglutaminase-like domain-containing protein [Micromonosporaceae bacterium]|jgi:hypothetical protein|nr:DUF3488 and transglutaminase-like domain-containing protein [Micromonosporaceae bacterium]